MRDTASIQLCAVAIATGAWTCVAPQPAETYALCDVDMPMDFCQFSGNELLRSEAKDDVITPRLASFVLINLTVPSSVDKADISLVDDCSPNAIMASHGASETRMHLPRALNSRPWICTRRMAGQVWPDAPDYDLRALAAWRNLHPSVTGQVGEDPIRVAVAEVALLTALLLIDLIEQRSINELCVGSTSFLLPTDPAPDLDDEIGWGQVVDDDLTWLGRLGGDDDWKIRLRAAEEIERRFRTGSALPHLDQPPIYSAESCHGIG